MGRHSNEDIETAQSSPSEAEVLTKVGILHFVDPVSDKTSTAACFSNLVIFTVWISIVETLSLFT